MAFHRITSADGWIQALVANETANIVSPDGTFHWAFSVDRPTNIPSLKYSPPVPAGIPLQFNNAPGGVWMFNPSTIEIGVLVNTASDTNATIAAGF